MAIQPPRFGRTQTETVRRTWASTTGGKTRQERGYGRDHELMRQRVLTEEPFCRAACGRLTVIADHIRPRAEGGGNERSNYQGLCRPCHAAKTAQESQRARQRAADRD